MVMLAALILLITAILFRVLPPLLHIHHDWMSNFSPVASIVLCGALFFPKRMALWLPLVLLGVTDLVLNHFAYHAPLFTWEILPRYLVFLVIGATAFTYRKRLAGRTIHILAASLVSSLFFYFASNSASWIGDPGYAKTFLGWTQAMTTGLPGFPPSWIFFRNSVVSDVLFTGLFLLSMVAGSTKIMPVVSSDLARVK